MKHLFVANKIGRAWGGLERYNYEMLKCLRMHGEELFSYVHTNNTDDLEGVDLLPYHKYIDRLLIGKRLELFAKRNKVDALHCMHLRLSKIVEKLSEATGKKYNLFVYGRDCWGVRFKKYNLDYEKIAKIISISDYTTEQIVSQGARPEKIIQIPPLIDTSESQESSYENKEKDFILISVGRLDPESSYKGQDMVIRALPRIAERVPSVQYWIVGKGENSEGLAKLAEENGVSKRVSFLGFVSDEHLKELYGRSTVFIMPSRVSLDPPDNPQGEGFGIVYLEAGLHGLPVIGPNEGGPRDVIRDGVNGFAVNPRSLDEIAEAVIKLAKSEGLRKEMAANAKRIVKERFSLSLLPKYIEPLMRQDSYIIRER